MTEEEIIRKIQKGETELFDHLIRKYQKDVFKMVYSIIRNIDDTDDLVQESFVKAFINIKKFRMSAAFKTWLMSIALNTVRSYIKKKSYIIPIDEEFINNIRDERTDNKLDARQIEEFLNSINNEVNKFSPMQRIVFLLRLGEEKTIKEIAEHLRIKEGTVKSHLNRIFIKLRKKFYKEYQEIFLEE